jgi:hypothetical protein
VLTGQQVIAPEVEVIDWYQAAPPLECLAESRSVLDPLGPSR